MKKLIGLSVAVLITGMSFAQDSTANTNSNSPAGMDTVPSTNMNKDTSALGRTNQNWNDTASKKAWPDSSLGNNANQKWPDSSAAPATQMQTKQDSSTGTATTPAATAAPATSPTATTPAATSTTDSTATATTVVEDKVIMKDEKMYVVKNGDSTLLADSLTLPSGAVVKSDATVTFKDGSTTKLKNGQYIAIKPAPVEATTTTTSTTTTTAAADSSASAGATKAVAEDKVVMIDDKVMLVKNGDSTLLEEDIKLKSGAVVSKDGTVKFKTGTTTKLKNGQFIALNPAPIEEKATKTKKTTTRKKKSS